MRYRALGLSEDKNYDFGRAAVNKWRAGPYSSSTVVFPEGSGFVTSDFVTNSSSAKGTTVASGIRVLSSLELKVAMTRSQRV